MYTIPFYCDNKKFLFIELIDEYVLKTAQLLNKEWPRSQCQRVLSLKPNLAEDKLKLPISLIIVDTETDQVIGHASVTSITTTFDLTTNLVFIQSVIIDPIYRSKGLGKKLMSETEKYIVEYSKLPQTGLMKTNCDYVYLNTKDKQLFYESLGYIQIEQILFYANKNTKCNFIMKNLLQSMSSQSTQNTTIKSNQTNFELNDCESSTSLAPLAPPVPAPPLPPPPPPLPKQTRLNSSNNDENSTENVTWYKKRLSLE